MGTFMMWFIFTVGGFLAILMIGFLLIADSSNLFANIIDFLQQFPLLYNFALLGLVLGIFLMIALGIGIYLIFKRYRKFY